MDCTLRSFKSGLFSDDVAGIVEVWNRALATAHGFFPLAASSYRTRIVRCPRFRPERLLLACRAGEIVGLLHADLVKEAGYPPAGVIEAIAVRPECRRQGIGGALLAAGLEVVSDASLDLVEGSGCWPYSPFYSTLIDGSERSGIFLNNAAALGLFANFGFRRGRESLVMRRTLAETPQPASPPLPDDVSLVHRPRCTGTWLDFAFRGWQLFDHELRSLSGETFARAIYGRMDGQSGYAGRELYALFGVNTAEACRRQGWATRNLALILEEIRSKGGQEIELHVYADNEPAIGLYRKLGFVEIGRTASLTRAAI